MQKNEAGQADQNLLQSLGAAVEAGRAPKAEEGAREALALGLAPEDVVSCALIPAMGRVGERFRLGEAFVPEMMMSARAMQAALNVLRPLLAARKARSLGTAVIGTVQGDQHDIGKNLVAMMLEGSDFDVVDLGSGVSPQRFVQAVAEAKASVLCLSALLTTTMPQMRATLQTLEEAGLRQNVKVMIGGAPVTQDYADRIGADGYAPDAASAALLAREWMGAAADSGG
ncbi:MAG: corrinoid protein [Oscillospiraceae bacterium]|jgi:corrinoid protein of di/trimethylamine methyltransferase|nr:corrinoid protein [Oscillospiraceae bacterium]